MPLLVLYNPVSGNSSGKQIVEEHILPLLSKHGKVADRVVSTERPGHAGSLVVDFIDQFPAKDRVAIDIVLVSGDGTLHEIVNLLDEECARRGDSKPFPRFRIALIPGGTANALYSSFFPQSTGTETSSHQFASLDAFLGPTPSAKTLSLSHTVITPPHASSQDSETRAHTSVVSVVVTSTSLHASILHDSEALRKGMPGIERFKVAAQQNATRWYHSRVRLLPFTPSSSVQRYDPVTDAFAPVSEAETELDGPFAYFLSTINVDRLEPAFRISPLARSHPSASTNHEDGAIDVVVVRPKRDPSVKDETEETRTRFTGKAWQVLGSAYANGAHVKLRYGAEGEVGEGGIGLPVVEYFRVGGWEWIPVSASTVPTESLIILIQDKADEEARLLCADGTIFTIPPGGKALSRILSQTSHKLNLAVYI